MTSNFFYKNYKEVIVVQITIFSLVYYYLFLSEIPNPIYIASPQRFDNHPKFRSLNFYSLSEMDFATQYGYDFCLKKTKEKGYNNMEQIREDVNECLKKEISLNLEGRKGPCLNSFELKSWSEGEFCERNNYLSFTEEIKNAKYLKFEKQEKGNLFFRMEIPKVTFTNILTPIIHVLVLYSILIIFVGVLNHHIDLLDLNTLICILLYFLLYFIPTYYAKELPDFDKWKKGVNADFTEEVRRFIFIRETLCFFINHFIFHIILPLTRVV